MSVIAKHFTSKGRKFNQYGYRTVGMTINATGTDFVIALLVEHEDDHHAAFIPGVGDVEVLPVTSVSTEREARELGNALWLEQGL